MRIGGFLQSLEWLDIIDWKKMERREGGIEVFDGILFLSFLGLFGIVWLYVVARVITRAVTRTLDERKRRKKDGEEKAKG